MGSTSFLNDLLSEQEKIERGENEAVVATIVSGLEEGLSLEEAKTRVAAVTVRYHHLHQAVLQFNEDIMIEAENDFMELGVKLAEEFSFEATQEFGKKCSQGKNRIRDLADELSRLK